LSSVLDLIKELRNLYSSSGIIRVIKSKRMKLAGHAARIDNEKCVHNFSWREDHLGNLDMNGRLLLK